MKIELTNKSGATKKLSQFLKKFGEENQINSSILLDLDLALGELLNNILKYGYKGNENIFIEIICEKAGSNIKGFLRDGGLGFNPMDFKIQDSSSMSLQQRKMGGLGLSIAGNILNFTKYERKEDKNQLEFTKSLKSWL